MAWTANMCKMYLIFKLLSFPYLYNIGKQLFGNKNQLTNETCVATKPD